MNNLLLKPIKILLVEDSVSDIKLISKALEEVSTHHHLEVVSDGLSAIAFLLKKGKYRHCFRPDIILLDLHLPQKDGLTVLREIKSNLKLSDIPVIMLSGSKNDYDITECYKEEANCYLVKPNNIKEFKQIIKSLTDFWLQMVKLPTV